MGAFMGWFGFGKVREELEARISGLENEKTELLRENENLAVKISELENEKTKLAKEIKALSTERDNLIASHKEETELERELERLLSLKNTDKNELDLQNMRFKNENRKLKEENITLKEQLSKLQQ
ncbi:hypothetical protein AA973_00285 [Helicobacter pylori]|uniref:Uncharacterized protein n=2 Tax=Helicobacter pylori TaxID=210 RepID=A0A1A9H6U8_HELPX|nr:hypothetical protein AA973_00285 [Helicobacter pylori]